MNLRGSARHQEAGDAEERRNTAATQASGQRDACFYWAGVGLVHVRDLLRCCTDFTISFFFELDFTIYL